MVEQNVAGTTEPDDIEGAVVIGMMPVNALRAFAFTARLDIDPTVALHDRDDARSVLASAKSFIRLQQVVAGSHVIPRLHFQFPFVLFSPLAVIRSIFRRTLIAAARYAVFLCSPMAALISTLDSSTGRCQSKVSATFFHMRPCFVGSPIRLSPRSDFGRLLILTNTGFAPASQSVGACA